MIAEVYLDIAFSNQQAALRSLPVLLMDKMERDEVHFMDSGILGRNLGTMPYCCGRLVRSTRALIGVLALKSHNTVVDGKSVRIRAAFKQLAEPAILRAHDLPHSRDADHSTYKQPKERSTENIQVRSVC